MKKRKIWLALVAVIMAAASMVKAGDMVNFDVATAGTLGFMEALKNADSCQNANIACEVSKPEAVSRNIQVFSPGPIKKEPIQKQQLIKNILRDFNGQISHNKGIEESLKENGTIVVFKLPGDILIVKNNETSGTINDPALQETIRQWHLKAGHGPLLFLFEN